MSDERQARDAALIQEILRKALDDAPFDGFTPALLENAAKAAGIGTIERMRLFPDGVLSLLEHFSTWADDEMLARLATDDWAEMKIRARIQRAIVARLDVLRPYKEAARRAGSFLSLPPNAPRAARLVWHTADAIWRAVGDRSSDFTYYTKRLSLSAVWSATLLRWFNDDSEDEAATQAFLIARIDNALNLARIQRDVEKRLRDMPSLSDLFAPKPRRRAK